MKNPGESAQAGWVLAQAPFFMPIWVCPGATQVSPSRSKLVSTRAPLSTLPGSPKNFWPALGATNCSRWMPALMQKLAPGPAFSTAAWIHTPGDSAMASGGQLASAALVTATALAGWLCVCELDAARTTSAAAVVSSIGVLRDARRSTARRANVAHPETDSQYIS